MPQRGAEVRPLHNQSDSIFTNYNFSLHSVCMRVSVSPSVSFPADLKNTHKVLPWLLELLLQLTGDSNAGRPYVDVWYGLPSNTAQHQGELVRGKWDKNPGKKKSLVHPGEQHQMVPHPSVQTSIITMGSCSPQTHRKQICCLQRMQVILWKTSQSDLSTAAKITVGKHGRQQRVEGLTGGSIVVENGGGGARRSAHLTLVTDLSGEIGHKSGYILPRCLCKPTKNIGPMLSGLNVMLPKFWPTEKENSLMPSTGCLTVHILEMVVLTNGKPTMT